MLTVERQPAAPSIEWRPDLARAQREPGYANAVREFVLGHLPFVTWTSAEILRDADSVRCLVAQSHYDTAGDALRDRAGRPTTRTASVPLAPDEVGP